MSARIPELTGLRCVAVMMVVLTHAAGTFEGGYTGVLYPLRYFSNGGLGVQIFFVLSGFLITNLLHAEWKAWSAIDLPQFYLRRTLRIWPAFYAYILVLVLLSACQVLDIGWRQFAFAALHVWNYSEALGLGQSHVQHPDGAWYLGHFWTLALEEQFYWFWPPLLIFLLRGRGKGWLLGLILLMPLVRVAFYFLTPSLRGQLGMMLHTGVDSILIGCLTALGLPRIQDVLERHHGAALVTACCIALVFVNPLLGSALGNAWSATYGTTFNGVCIAVILAGLVTMKDLWLSRLLRLRPFIFVGTISYSLYLWQQLFLVKDSLLAWAYPFNIVQAFAAATLSYWLIETPFLKIKDGRKHKRAMAMAPQAAGDTTGGK
jgi:peptidoglycan/LPS O-acetylase OafA/YrhL